MILMMPLGLSWPRVLRKNAGNSNALPCLPKPKEGDLEKRALRALGLTDAQARDRKVIENMTALQLQCRDLYYDAASSSETTRLEYVKLYQTLLRWGRLSGEEGVADASRGVDADVQVLDIPSFSEAEEALVISMFMLVDIWKRARRDWEDGMNDPKINSSRTPRLIVIDEAHNLIPSTDQLSPLKREIKELFKTIAAEGRKYGLFLVICTQRPDKVDAQVVSECTNHAIMMLRSPEVLIACGRSFGIELEASEIEMISKRFTKGFVRLQASSGVSSSILHSMATSPADVLATMSGVRVVETSDGRVTAMLASAIALAIRSSNSVLATFWPVFR